MPGKLSHSERGGTRLKTLTVVAIFAVMIISAIKIVPAYVVNYELQDSMQEEATFASVNRTSADDIRSDVQKKLQDLGMNNIDSKNIQVSAIAGNVQISVDYTVPVDLAFYQLRLHFHPQADNAPL